MSGVTRGKREHKEVQGKGAGAAHSGIICTMRGVEALGSGDPVNKNETIRLLQSHKQTLAERFGVTSLALFGSFARDEATGDSDLDILVTFDGPATSRSYFGVQFYIEDLTGRTVDLVTDKALRPELRPSVERDCVHV